LEKYGYDVTYASCSDVEDMHTHGLLLTKDRYRILLSLGHDESLKRFSAAMKPFGESYGQKTTSISMVVTDCRKHPATNHFSIEMMKEEW